MEELITQPWFYILVFILTVLLGGIVGFIYFNQVFLKKDSPHIKISDEDLAMEIVNIRSRIQLIYIIGPMIGLILTFFGVQSYSDLNSLQNKQIKEGVDDWIKDNKFQNDLDLIKQVRNDLKKIQEGKLVYSDQIRNLDENAILNAVAGKFLSIEYQKHDAFLSSYLQRRGVIRRLDELENSLGNKLNRLEFTNRLDPIDRQLNNLHDEYLSKSYEQLLTEYNNRKNDLVTSTQLRSNFSGYLIEFLPNNITEANLSTKVQNLTTIEELERKTDLTYLNRLIDEREVNYDLRANMVSLLSDTSFVSHLSTILN